MKTHIAYRHLSMRTKRQHDQHGLSLVELMVTIVIALLTAGAVAAIFLAQTRVSQTTGLVVSTNDAGRTALEWLRRDLEHAGFWGTAWGFELTYDGNFNRNVSAACDAGAATRPFPDRPDQNSAPVLLQANAGGQLVFGGGPCISGAVPNSHAIVLRFAAPAPLERNAIDNNTAYVASSDRRRVLTMGSNADGYNDGRTRFFEYRWVVYFIRDVNQTPTLARARLTRNGNNWQVQVDDLVSDVEDLNMVVEQSRIDLCVQVRSPQRQTGMQQSSDARCHANAAIADMRFLRQALHTAVHARNLQTL